jgi:predicted site-specific integrase-resolvase
MSSTTVEMPRLMTPEEVSEYIKIKPMTLAIWRSTGRYNLPFVKAGGRVMYKAKDVLAFIEEGRHVVE